MALYSNYYGRWLKEIDAWLLKAPSAEAAEGGATGSSEITGPVSKLTEPLATCDNCLMADSGRLTKLMTQNFAQDPLAKRDPGPFKKDLRCCTYQPYLPNFVVGELLAIGSPKLLQSFDFWLESGALQPQGLILGADISSEELAEGFGINEHLLCPFLDHLTQGCSIWAHRPAVCSSYQCVSRYGSRGQEFWSELEALLNQFEWTLAHEVLWRMGWTEDDLETSKDLSFEFTDQSVFLEHAGREREFYLKCRENAHEVTAAELFELLGETAAEAKDSLQHLYSGLRSKIGSLSSDHAKI